MRGKFCVRNFGIKIYGVAEKREHKRLLAIEKMKPVGHGPFGPIFDQFIGRSVNAIDFLMRLKAGEAIGALYHISVGNIDLVWGVEGTEHSDGYGLAKIAKYHPEVLNNLQGVLDSMHEVSRSDNRVKLESDTHEGAISLRWFNEPKTWLLTVFEKKNSVLDNTMNTDETPKGKRNDTATPQNTVSAGKGSDNSETSKGEG